MATRTGVVLGAGGVLGAAWTIGALAALQEQRAWDPRDAEVLADAGVAALHDRGVAVERRIVYKEQLVAGLLEHRYALDEVAREFVQVIEEDETNLAVLRETFGGRTDEERAARNVIAYVRTQSLPPYEMSRAIAHLQAEFSRLYPTR